MIFERSEKIENAFLAALEHVSKPNYPTDEGLEKLWDTADAIAPYGGSEEGDVYFEIGIEFARKFPDIQSIYRMYNIETAYYFVGDEDEIVDRFEVVYKCICDKQVLLRSGCQCGGE